MGRGRAYSPHDGHPTGQPIKQSHKTTSRHQQDKNTLPDGNKIPSKQRQARASSILMVFPTCQAKLLMLSSILRIYSDID